MSETLPTRRNITRQELSRDRARRTPEEQGATANGTPSPHHDVLVIGPEGVQGKHELFRIPVVKVPKQHSSEPVGNYLDRPEKLDPYDYASRRTTSFSRPQDWGARIKPERPRGTAFGTLPVKREPAATACFACYLIDAQNLSFRNAWTAEEWNDISDVDYEPHPSADDRTMEVMLAGPRGKVFYLRVNLEDNDQDLWPAGHTEALPSGAGFIESVDLRHEMEIWNQLRNGCVAGRVVSYTKAAREGKSLDDVDYVPLVNITSLVPDELVPPAGSTGGLSTDVTRSNVRKL